MTRVVREADVFARDLHKVKTKISLGLGVSLLIGVILGLVFCNRFERVSVKKAEAPPKTTYPIALTFQPIGGTNKQNLAVMETQPPSGWLEFRSNEWNVAVVWFEDENEKETRIYGFRQEGNGWREVVKDTLRYSEHRFGHLEMNYPDRSIMVIDNEGLLIHSLLFEGR